MSYMNEAVDGVRKREHREYRPGAMRRSPDRAIYGCTRRKSFLRSTSSNYAR
jgi:hypothetical protein